MFIFGTQNIYVKFAHALSLLCSFINRECSAVLRLSVFPVCVVTFESLGLSNFIFDMQVHLDIT